MRGKPKDKSDEKEDPSLMGNRAVSVASKPKNSTRERPAMFRALGRNEPATSVVVDGQSYDRTEIFKHDSWAATAVYSSATGRKIVCKFNRQSPVGLIPMRWLGRFLGNRERFFLQSMAGVPGIPYVFREVKVDGRVKANAVAHEFIEGKPLSLSQDLTSEFFDKVERVLAELHKRRIAYVDLHKQENVLVGDDGLPYLIDFQVSLQLPRGRLFEKLFGIFRDMDLYHLSKHRWLHTDSRLYHMNVRPPWFIQFHRRISAPLRTLRRRFMVAIGVRSGRGYSNSEVATEVGLRSDTAT